MGEIVKQLRAAADGQPATDRESFEQRLLREIDSVALARRATERVARLFDVSAALGRAATTEAVAQAVVEHGVAALGASGGGILLAGDADRLSVPATVGYDEDVVARLRAESRDAELPAAEALRTGESVWLESREDRDSRFPLLSALEPQAVSACAVPLAIGDRRLGALRFSFAEARLFDEEERRFVEALAAQTAQALDRTQLYETRADLSRRFQRSLLPGDMAPPPGVEVAGSYHPLGDGMELGGDTFDLWPLGGDLWGIAIADAAGTGPEAAALTAMIRFTLRALSMSDVEPASVLRDLNRALLAAGAAGADGERFCTVIFGVLTPTPDGSRPHPGRRRPPPPRGAAGRRRDRGGRGRRARCSACSPTSPSGTRTVDAGPRRRPRPLHRRSHRGPPGRGDVRRRAAWRMPSGARRPRPRRWPTRSRRRWSPTWEATMTDDLAVLVVRVLGLTAPPGASGAGVVGRRAGAARGGRRAGPGARRPGSVGGGPGRRAGRRSSGRPAAAWRTASASTIS